MDPQSVEANIPASYGVFVSYPFGTTSLEVVSATYQVVNGINYDMNVAVTTVGNGSCTMQNFVVLRVAENRLPFPFVLKSKTELTSQECPCG